jgi:hypothetical protein
MSFDLVFTGCYGAIGALIGVLTVKHQEKLGGAPPTGDKIDDGLHRAYWYFMLVFGWPIMVFCWGIGAADERRLRLRDRLRRRAPKWYDRLLFWVYW